MWTLRVVVACCVVIGIVLVLRKRFKKKKQIVSQKNPEIIKPRAPGGKTPILHGIRVVEVGNTIAVPVLGRLLGELGAEVIKVEPPNGDPWRKWLLEYEQPRTKGSSFDMCNLGKSSISLDFAKKDDMDMFHTLLASADVLITNTRPESLARANIEQDTICQQHPHLVYLAMSAWGRLGEEAQRAGYDLGAFWAATGMAASIMGEAATQMLGAFNIYPIGFGDTATSGVMVAAVCTALRRRLVTGHGGPIDASLTRTAAWCMAPHLVDNVDPNDGKGDGDILNGVAVRLGDERPDYDAIPTRHPLSCAYPARDGQGAVIIDTDNATGLRQALDMPATAALSADTLRVAFAAFDLPTVCARLTAEGIPHSKMWNIPDIIQQDLLDQDPIFSAAQALGPKIVDDVAFTVRAPFVCDSSDQQGPQRPAPECNEHGDAIRAKPWSDRHPQAALPTDVTDPALAATMSEPGCSLADVIVVELASSLLAAGTGTLLADHGARVMMVEEEKGGLRASLSPHVFRQFARGKTGVVVGHDRAAFDALLSTAHVFLTDLDATALADRGLALDDLRRRFPKLIVSHVSPYGYNAEHSVAHLPNDGAGAFWVSSGIASSLTGSRAVAVPLPLKHVPELLTSLYAFGGTSAALFHQRRTQEGQRVDTNMLRAGMFSQLALTFAVILRDPSKATSSFVEPQSRRMNFLVPTAHAVQTKDGYWIQLLGAELPRHFKRTFKAIGCGPGLYASLAWTVVTKVLPSREKALTEKVLPAMNLLNAVLHEKTVQFTLAELEERFAKHDVWWTRIRMPRNFRGYKQAHVNGVFQLPPNETIPLVASPIDFDHKHTPCTRPPASQKK